MRGRPVSVTLLASIVLALLVLVAPGASATSSEATSAPAGDLTVILSTGATTDKDGDGNVDTATRGDRLQANSQVLNNTAEGTPPQAIDITLSVDGPDGVHDATFSRQVVLGPGDSVVDFQELFKGKKDTPTGLYTVTITASGSETVSTSATFTVS